MGNANEKFNEFVKDCILSDDSLLTTTTNLFTKDHVKSTIDFLRAIKPIMDGENKEARKYNKTSKNDKKKKTWGIGDIFDGTVFNDESFKWNEKDTHVKLKDFIIQILLHCNWLMYLCSDRQHKQSGANKYYKDNIDNYFKVDTAWAIGATFSGESMDAMLFIVELINKLKPESKDKLSENAEEQPVKEAEAIIKDIEGLCNDNNKEGLRESIKWEDKDEKSILSNAIVNILLYLCDNERYLPIPAQNKKEQIYENMKDLVGDIQVDKSLEGMSETDKNLYKIREKLRKITDEKENALYSEENPFWRPDILPFWNESKENLGSDELPVETLLQYKKAMVLYGPPGTSKSYQARQIAESMIAKAIKREKGHDLNNCIKELKESKESHIHILQMHPGYTYDDFIIGKVIDEQGKIAIKPGKLLQIIKKIDSKDAFPHFVILDEINRVDISRVFGELFTAMEPSYRKDGGVELSVDVSLISDEDKNGLNIDKVSGKLYLKVPENMYFIGTMNMIDFSLEQVDFALRRRFLWKLSTYNKKRLNEIISEKVRKKINDIQEKIEQNKVNKNENENEKLGNLIIEYRNLPDNFIECCSALNDEITWESSLGENYLIGHAFFAEIVDIFAEIKDWDKAKNVLWQISILPTLEAYCGTMDSDMQKKFIGNCKKAFMPEPKQEKQSKGNKKENKPQEQNSQEA